MITVLSLFSGGGGLDLGFISEGYKILWAIDNTPNAVATYKANIGDHIVCEDINRVNVAALPKADVVIGGPPCQSFSLAGNRHTEDDRGRLVWKYIEIIDSVKPKAFVFENVTGLQSARNKAGEKILPQLEKAFQEIGYTINVKVLNAADYGVPQRRNRVIIVGLKSGKHFEFPKPTHSEQPELTGLKPYVSVRDALGDLPPASEDDKDVLTYSTQPENDFQAMMRSSTGITEHTLPQMSELDKFICHHVRPGGNYMDIPTNVNSTRIRRLQINGGHTTCYGRMDPNKPSYTINTYFNRPNVGCNIHFAEERLITIREALRLQSFPDSYRIVSTSKQGKHLIVGNAVPPLLGKVIACQLKAYLGGADNVD